MCMVDIKIVAVVWSFLCVRPKILESIHHVMSSSTSRCITWPLLSKAVVLNRGVVVFSGLLVLTHTIIHCPRTRASLIVLGLFEAQVQKKG